MFLSLNSECDPGATSDMAYDWLSLWLIWSHFNPSSAYIIIEPAASLFLQSPSLKPVQATKSSRVINKGHKWYYY